MKRLVTGIVAALLLTVLIGQSNTALAHPLGNFTVNRYAGLLVQSREITVDYVVDMAEIPAYQEITQQMNGKGGEAPEAAPAAIYRQRKCPELLANLVLSLQGTNQPVALVDSAIEFPPGAGGLPTLRLTCTYRAELAYAEVARSVVFQDTNFSERIGWRELVVQGDGVSISGSNVPAVSISNRLRSYPNDLINSPPRQFEARFQFQLGAASSNPGSPQSQGGILDRTQDAFAALIAVNDLSLPVILLSLIVALGLGALHAVSPGHGKTIMAAYLVGARGTVPQALLLGLTVTVTHTVGVLALGILTLFASRYILPESLYPWLSFISGLIVIGMGVNLAFSRWRMMQRRGQAGAHPAHEHEHDHVHLHHHQDVDGEPLLHEHHDEDTDFDLAHGHSHLPADMPEAELTWKSLIGLGLVGGLVPSTSALIVLLAAISLQRIALGIVLVIAFGLGMALVLVGTGLILVRASHVLMGRKLMVRSISWMPLASALVVIGAGLFVTAEATLQLGIWKP